MDGAECVLKALGGSTPMEKSDSDNELGMVQVGSRLKYVQIPQAKRASVAEFEFRKVSGQSYHIRSPFGPLRPDCRSAQFTRSDAGIGPGCDDHR